MRASYLVVAFVALLPGIASAAETTTYTYDAKGRLTEVKHSGGRNDGARTSYALDAADNRTSVTASGYRSGVVVVPLNGMTVISLAGS